MIKAMAVQSFKLRVIEKKNLVGKFWSIKFVKPEGFEYIAGQYISILVADGGERRSYSLASWPRTASHGVNQTEKLELIFDVKPGGLGSGYLFGLEVGQEIEVMGVMGRFVIADQGDLSEERKLLFVGTGSGVVPLRSMIHDLLETKGFKGLLRLHWGMRSDDELFMMEELDDLKARFPNFSYDVVMSQPSEKWANCRGHVQDCLVGHGENWSGWEAYLCGSQKMVLDVAALLQTKGIEKEKIYFEKFY